MSDLLEDPDIERVIEAALRGQTIKGGPGSRVRPDSGPPSPDARECIRFPDSLPSVTCPSCHQRVHGYGGDRYSCGNGCSRYRVLDGLPLWDGSPWPTPDVVAQHENIMAQFHHYYLQCGDLWTQKH